MLDPLHQFIIHPLLPLRWQGYDISFTNASLFMMVTISLIGFVFFFLTKEKAVIPSRSQASMEILYLFVKNMLMETLGDKGKPYFPFILSLFLFVLFGNLIGLFPYAYTITSQVIVTFTLAMMVFIFVVFSGFYHHGLKFFRIFFPKGSPVALAPLLIPIEIISFFSRPLSLSLRLFVNMVAGHCILKIFASFGEMLGPLGVFPLIFNVFFIFFEVLVAFIQAYIFSTLSCLYLKDTLALH